MLDTTRCQPYFDEVVRRAKEMGLYEPVKPEPKADDRWFTGEDAARQQCIIRHVRTPMALSTETTEPLVTYSVWLEGVWSQEAITVECSKFKATWSPRWAWDPTRDGKLQFLRDKLDYLDGYGGSRESCEVVLRQDRLSPLSFDFDIYKILDNPESSLAPKLRKHMFNGGLTFHGDHDGHGSGIWFTPVTLTAVTGWSIHT
jgi:hypothetical protein